MDESTTARPENILNIMLATDNHLGYNEKDSHRGNDSFETFEEILQLAIQNDVDLILLGGDLFHEARPSPSCLLQCMKLIRKYTFGDKPISVEFLSENDFHESIINRVNYEDPNINVSIPIFSIHGNHDDPTGYKHVSSLDLLSCNGLVNYFGKTKSLTKVTIEPLLMRKGETKVALYGLSHIKDERLARLFAEQAVTMIIPEENKQNQDEWFNILTLHQNRANRGLKKYVPEDVLPEFLDLIIWGHEHECRIEPEYSTQRNLYVTQPGSSVATSLAQGESVTKKVAILQIHMKEFKIVPIKLQTVRPFVFNDLNLHDIENEVDIQGPDAQKNVQEYIDTKIELLIEESKLQLTGHPQQPVLPLIRLRVTYFDECQVFNTIRFGQRYMERVANPTDMVVLKKFKSAQNKTVGSKIDSVVFEEAFNDLQNNDSTRVEDIIERYYNEMGDRKDILGLSIKAMGEAVSQLIDKDDDQVVGEFIDHQSKSLMNFLKKTYPAEENIHDGILKYSENMNSAESEAIDMLKNRLKISGVSKRTWSMAGSSDEENVTNTITKSSRGKVSTRGSRSRQLDITINSTSDSTKSIRGKSTRGRGTRGKNSILTSGSQIQPSITSSFKSAPNVGGRKKPVVYISDSD